MNEFINIILATAGSSVIISTLAVLFQTYRKVLQIEGLITGEREIHDDKGLIEIARENREIIVKSGLYQKHVNDTIQPIERKNND